MTSTPPDQPDADPARPDTAAPAPRYRRALLKISGEAFSKPGNFGIDGDELDIIAREIADAAKVGTQLAVVVGGGNIIRGAQLAQAGHIQQATADYMGMLGTALNGLALKEALENLGQPARVLSALNLSSVAETFIRGRAIRHLEKGRVVIFVAGTGNPFFTTDSAASLRAAEIGADVLLKATKVDGIYDRDPHKHSDAKRYDRLTFREAIEQQLKIMDITAFSMCMDRNIPVVVFNMKEPGHIAEVVRGMNHGTRVEMD
ncbi:UMP kinase [Phycisphaerales bacterium AB-hyl4]|uniref:Uridylate kinase n=1 Tax=Natronomicrosphaera hydrolytica TaxID=3242702 RepID=A0ABV4U8G3_9BACT